MKTILITGSRGFTGRYVRQQFEHAGYQVIGMVTNQPQNAEVCCDLTDKAQVKQILNQVKPDGIIHLAALSFVGHGDAAAFYRINTLASLTLLETVAELGLNLDKIVIASSANIYGNTALAKIDEQVALNPANHYAASKVAMEYLVKNWFETLPIIIVRPFNYTGVGQDKKFLVPKIVSHFCEHQPTIQLGNLDVARDFSDVRDIAYAYLKLYEAPIRSEIVNVCSGQVTSLAQIIHMMNQIAGYEIAVQVNPEFVRANEIKVLGGNPHKLQQLTGFVPKISLTETLHTMYLAGHPS